MVDAIPGNVMRLKRFGANRVLVYMYMAECGKRPRTIGRGPEAVSRALPGQASSGFICSTKTFAPELRGKGRGS